MSQKRDSLELSRRNVSRDLEMDAAMDALAEQLSDALGAAARRGTEGRDDLDSAVEGLVEETEWLSQGRRPLLVTPIPAPPG